MLLTSHKQSSENSNNNNKLVAEINRSATEGKHFFSGKTRFGYLLPLFVGRSVRCLTAQFAAAEDYEGENRRAAH